MKKASRTKNGAKNARSSIIASLTVSNSVAICIFDCSNLFFSNHIVHIFNSNFTIFENDLNFYLVGNTGLSITNLYGMAR